jgi:predicted dehydrogenase
VGVSQRSYQVLVFTPGGTTCRVTLTFTTQKCRNMRERAKRSLLRFAVVGAGSISSEFALNHLCRENGALVTSIVDCDHDRAQKLAEEVGAAGSPVHSSTSLDKHVLDAADAVYIGSTPASHAALVQSALESGKHVLLEKPIAASAEDADTIVALSESAAARGIILGMDIGMRWNKAIHKMRTLAIVQTSLGPLVSARLDLHFARWPREWQVVPWCAGRTEGGALREVGTHFLFAILEIFGQNSVKQVRAETIFPDGPDGAAAEAAVTGVLQLDCGIEVALSVRTDGTGLCAADGDDHYELEVRGESGGLLLDEFTTLYRLGEPGGARKCLVRKSTYGRRECVETLVAAAATGGALAGHGRGGSSSGEGGEGIVTARQGRNAQRVLDALLASQGAWINVYYDDSNVDA